MTNGEKIKEMFPNGVLTSGGNNSYYWGDDILVSKNLWNAEYKEPTTKNDLQVDVVSRQAVRDTIFEECSSTKLDIDFSKVLLLQRAIKALPSVTPQEPRWIPVSERYPQIEDEYKYFLVTDDKGKVSVQEFFISLDEEPQPYFSGMVNVIAWMPLPQPYREVEE